eukprot:1166756-Prymnesium_polylepis.2
MTWAPAPAPFAAPSLQRSRRHQRVECGVQAAHDTRKRLITRRASRGRELGVYAIVVLSTQRAPARTFRITPGAAGVLADHARAARHAAGIKLEPVGAFASSVVCEEFPRGTGSCLHRPSAARHPPPNLRKADRVVDEVEDTEVQALDGAITMKPPIGIRRGIVEVNRPCHALEVHPLDHRFQQLATNNRRAILHLD